MDLDKYVDGVRSGSRLWIGRAITLVESTRPDHREAAQELLVELLPHAGGARRIGISGVPGVGKSTFIGALGSTLTAAGSKVAVLAVDPSSTRSGGSILGDKTRMNELATDDDAFIRPSPTAGTLGGVAKATRETMVVMEAAGYDVVIVETVGVGQSETTVAQMVDSFLFLTLARTGDSLQGIKRGILEIADVIAVNKADGPHVREAKRAARELEQALAMLARGARDVEGPGPDLQRRRAHGSRRRVVGARARTRSTSRTRAASPRSAPASRWTGPGRWSVTACSGASRTIPRSRTCAASSSARSRSAS